MKQIIIKQLHLTNFKGMADLTVNFNDTITSISGCNGVGKTTIFDAFTWLLFGKDSNERKNFDIKTYDENGKTIERIPHEVSGVLSVDGEEITLCRKFNEKWTKKRGTSEEVFTGNEEERLYNDVPMSLKDWNEKINAICPEQVFKFITNPLYFSAQKTEVQRTMLFRMAGDVSDEAIAARNVQFKALLDNITGKTMDEYKREISAKKRRLKTEIEAIPERIDERKRDIPEPEDWDALENKLATEKQELASIDEQINDITKAYNAANEERMEISHHLADVRKKVQQCEYSIKEKVYADYMAEKQAQNKLYLEVEDKQKIRERLITNVTSNQQNLDACEEKREKMIAEWREINARTISFNENDFVCPTCHRRFEIDEIETKQSEMTERFNKQKAADLEENNKRGKANSDKMKEYQAAIDESNQKKQAIEADIANLKANPLYNKQLVEPDATPVIEADEDYKALIVQSEELALKVNKEIGAPDYAELKDRKLLIEADIDDTKKVLGQREYIKRNNTRIAELERELRTQSDELAKLEGIEFTIQEFSKARISAIEDRINGMFDIVKFKMFDVQINGGEVETCEAMAYGKPYSTQNNAMRYNMGIDIINAICKSEQITAPIFLDNAESINNIIPTASQLITLSVTTDKELVIK